MRTRAPAGILIETSISEVAELQTEDLVDGNAITRRESLSSALPVLCCPCCAVAGSESEGGPLLRERRDRACRRSQRTPWTWWPRTSPVASSTPTVSHRPTVGVRTVQT